MALKIIPDSDPILHTKCEPFNPRTIDFPLKETINEMFELMSESNGIGLAAPQVGLSMRFFVMEISGIKTACINPKITRSSTETSISSEGCLSYPGAKVMVTRPSSVRVEYKSATGAVRKKSLRGTNARCFQHELDHLNGVVIGDIGELVSVGIQHKGPEDE